MSKQEPFDPYVVPMLRAGHGVKRSVRRLETFIARMERRYECASVVMEREVREGRTRETAEVARWLADYRLLCELRRST